MNWIYVLFIIIIIVLFVLLLIYLNQQQALNTLISTPLPIADDNISTVGGVVQIINTDKICAYLDNCAGGNPSGIYGRVLFPTLSNISVRQIRNATTEQQESTIVGALNLTLNDAIVVWRDNIPENMLYWALTGYLYEIPQKNGYVPWSSIGDSVSSARVKGTMSQGSTHKIATIMTANPDLYNLLNGKISSLGYKIYPMLIPKYLYNPSYTYDLLSRYVPTTPDQILPKWEVMFVKANIINQNLVESVPFIPRGNGNSERNLLSLQDWVQKTVNIIKYNGYDIVRYHVGDVYLHESIPGGLNYGFQCPQYDQLCKADNRDTLYVVAQYIPINETQELIAVCLDHVALNKSYAYSNIGFFNQVTQTSYAGEFTGRIDEVKIPITNIDQAIRIVKNIPPSDIFKAGLGVVATTERIYVSETTVGPTFDSILPHVVFVVNRKF